jgi:hypothetical protein
MPLCARRDWSSDRPPQSRIGIQAGFWLDVLVWALCQFPPGSPRRDEGWRADWWYLLKHILILESLHDEPEFQAMVAEIEADMAEQLARVRELERNGELEPIPEASATIQ